MAAFSSCLQFFISILVHAIFLSLKHNSFICCSVEFFITSSNIIGYIELTCITVSNENSCVPWKSRLKHKPRNMKTCRYITAVDSLNVKNKECVCQRFFCQRCDDSDLY